MVGLGALDGVAARGLVNGRGPTLVGRDSAAGAYRAKALRLTNSPGAEAEVGDTVALAAEHRLVVGVDLEDGVDLRVGEGLRPAEPRPTSFASLGLRRIWLAA